MESARIGGGRLIDAPIVEFFDEDGDLMYRMLLANGTHLDIMLGDPMPLDEARAHIREQVMSQIREGRYSREEELFRRQRDIDDPELPDAPVAAYQMHHGFGTVPASSKAITDLQETVVGEEEGECLVCLQDFEAGSKLRMMPCSHSFHEHCIFNWLRVNHVCPLCRFALPTK